MRRRVTPFVDLRAGRKFADIQSPVPAGEGGMQSCMMRCALLLGGLLGCLLSRPLASFDAARAQDKLLPITVELGDVSLTKLPFVMAAEAGIYKRNGLEVKQFITPNAAELIRRSAGLVVPKDFVGTGAGDINIGGGSPTLVRMTSDARAPQRIVLATTDDVSRFHIISRQDLAGPQDLKGKRIGFSVVGALSHYVTILFAKRMGWDYNRDLSLFANGAGADVIKSGRVDAFTADEIALAEALRQGFKDLVDTGTYRFPMPGSGVNAEKSWLLKNREAAARFVKSTVEAVALLKNDKPAAFAAMAKWYGITEPAKQEEVYAQAAQLPSKPYPSVEGIKKMMEIYDYREMRQHRPEDFYDASFVAELDQSGYIDGLYKGGAAPR
jgi:NitT/TauT family transport system substrate-binding protein